MVGSYLVVTDQVVDGVEAHVVDEVVLGLASFRLGVDTTVIVLVVTPAGNNSIKPHPPNQGGVVMWRLTRKRESSRQ